MTETKRRAISVSIYDATRERAFFQVDWTVISDEGPSLGRFDLLRYDMQGSLWVGMAYGVPIFADVYRGTITIGGEEFSCQLAELEPFLR